jgi:Protein of unknown function (DUF2795)
MRGKLDLKRYLQIIEQSSFKSLGELSMAKTNPIQLQKHLKGVDYPATKEDLINHARQQGADQDLLSDLEQIPDQEYETPTEVNKAIGGEK